MLTYIEPITADEWRRLKATTRHRQYLARQLELDEDANAWLATVECDTRSA